MIRVAVVGLGKMGLSHYAIINAHKQVHVAAVCDSTGYVLDVLSKHTGIKTYTDYAAMLSEAELDAVIIATPSRFHLDMVRAALAKGLHVFCEKPFTLDWQQAKDLAETAKAKGLVNQVGYHYRFVGAYQEMKRVLDLGIVGKVSHVLAEAYGPVVLKPKGGTWRSQRSEGGGCLYDYAAHPINLLNWFFGMPHAAAGTVLNRVFSKDTEDEAYGTLYFDGGLSAQVSVNWSDESYRKMSTKLTVWGTNGRMYADRQELQVYLRDARQAPPGYRTGWNARYTTELTQPVDFYLRGEEYSAQLDYFVNCIRTKDNIDNINSFESATATDRVIAMMIADANGETDDRRSVSPKESQAPRRRFSFFGR